MTHPFLSGDRMRFDYQRLMGPDLQPALEHFEQYGFVVVDGVADTVTRHFKPIYAERLKVTLAEFEAILDPNSPPLILPVEIRERLSKVATPPELGTAVLTALGSFFAQLIGPLVHVSSDYHAQFKGGEVKPVDHGGYDPNAQYLEVQGQYLIHQDFCGASLPTSPSGITLWVGMNDCPDWNLRVYPGSHRHGLVCQQWLKLEDPRLAAFGTPVDIQAKAGSVVIFNSLLLHSSSNPGPRRRLSCDIRFFPLCGYLPSEVRALVPKPMAFLHERLARAKGVTLRAPLLETLAWLGQDVAAKDAPAHSMLDWVNKVDTRLHQGPQAALKHLARFVNPERGVDGLEAYTKFSGRPIVAATVRRARDLVAAAEPGAPELAGAGRLLTSLTAAMAS